jgi:hypothetical protein
MKLGTAWVGLRADRKQLHKDIKDAKDDISKAFVLFDYKVRQMLSLKNIGVGVTAFSALFGYAMKKSIDAASDLQEVTSKFNTVFKNQEYAAEQMSNTLVKSYAMSTRESKQYLSSIQDLLVPMGIQADAAGKLSFEVTKLAADLGSFNNIPTAKVMEDIQSALVGNFETMKKYGVVLNETVVSQQALTTGLAKNKNELTAAHKAQAAYELIVKGSTAAIGDMERTSGGYANQIKQLNASFEDIKATLGEGLLPIITSIVSATNDWLKANKELFSSIAAIVDIGTFEKGREMFRSGAMSASEYRKFVESGFGDRKKMLEVINAKNSFQDFNMPDQPMTSESVPDEDIYGMDYGKVDQELNKFFSDIDKSGEMARESLFSLIDDSLEAEFGWLEQETELLEQRNEIIKNNYEKETELWIQELEARYEADEKYTKKKIALQKAASRTFIADANYAMQYFTTQNKQAFEAYKVYKIAEATISGIDSAIKAWNAGMSTGGPWAPFVAAAYTAASLARTGALISQIQSTSFGGGGSSSGGGGGGASSGSYSSASAQGTEAYSQEEDKRGQMTVIIEGNVIGQEDYIIGLAEEISKAVEDKDVRLVASNARIAEALV